MGFGCLSWLCCGCYLCSVLNLSGGLRLLVGDCCCLMAVCLLLVFGVCWCGFGGFVVCGCGSFLGLACVLVLLDYFGCGWQWF